MLKGKMMFYHVLVETNEKDKNGNNRQYHQLDIDDKEKVLEKFAVRHLKGQPLRVYGYLIDNACRFVVTQSELNTETIRKVKQDELDRKQKSLRVYSSFRYSREIVSRDEQYTKDITDEILEEAQNSLDTAVSELKKEIPIYSNHKVFIVHGRDTLLRTQVENEF